MKPIKLKIDEDKFFVTSDFHIGHAKSWIFTARGFANIQDHDNHIFAQTEKIPEDSTLLFLGDFSLSDGVKSREETLEYTKMTMIKIFSKFKQVFYCSGNHESFTSKVFNMNLPELAHVQIFDYLELEVNKKFVVCCHYGLRSFNGESIRAFALNGHSHLSDPETHPETSTRKTLDCGWDYKLDYWKFSEIRKLMSTKGVIPVDHHAEQKPWSNSPIHKEIGEAGLYFSECPPDIQKEMVEWDKFIKNCNKKLDASQESPQNPPQ